MSSLWTKPASTSGARRRAPHSIGPSARGGCSIPPDSLSREHARLLLKKAEQNQWLLEAVLVDRRVGDEVGFFAATDETVSVASVPSDAVRPATDQDLLRVRVLNRCAK